MGDSDKLEPSGPDRYTFVEHRRYLDALLETLGVGENVTLVDAVKGIETHVRDEGAGINAEDCERLAKKLRARDVQSFGG